ncbi:MAG: hypothetical protein GMKNLPBB_01895 [Myxococcota bacterium]|nr:hypothetical protein [Myxococcota bacterium]
MKILLLLCFPVLVLLGCEQTKTGEKKPADYPFVADKGPLPATAAAEIGFVEKIVGGNVEIRRGADRRQAEVGTRLHAGDFIYTMKAAKVRVKLHDGSILWMKDMSAMHLANLDYREGVERKGAMELIVGRFILEVAKMKENVRSSFEVTTPTVVAGVRGTRFWSCTLIDCFGTLEGLVEIKSKVNPALETRQVAAGNAFVNTHKGQWIPYDAKPELIKEITDSVYTE